MCYNPVVRESAVPSCVRDLCVVGVTGIVERLSLVGSGKDETTAQTAQSGKCDSDVGCRGRYGFKAREMVAASLTEEIHMLLHCPAKDIPRGKSLIDVRWVLKLSGKNGVFEKHRARILTITACIRASISGLRY